MSGQHSSNRLSRRRLLALGGGVAGGAAVAGAATWNAAAATDWIRLPVVTANIGRKHLGARKAAINAVRNCDGDHRPLVGWQEIQEGDGDTLERTYITNAFGPAYQRPYLWDEKSYRVPLCVPAPWKITSRLKTFVHGGVSPKLSPPRWINEVVVEHTSHPGLEFALINTHYIANAYNGDQRADLRDEWNLMKEKHKARVLAHHKAGRLVIWTADTNNPNYRKATGWDVERRVFTGGIDRIDWMPGNGTVKLELLNTKSVNMDVDGHNARVAIFRIRLA